MNMPDPIDTFYTTRAWRKCRQAYLKSVGGLCEHCLKRGLVNAADEVHHKHKLTAETIGNPAITLGWDNLVALCESCHHEIHDSGRKRWRADQRTGHVDLR